MEDIQEKYNHLLQQNEALRQENEELLHIEKMECSIEEIYSCSKGV